MRAPARVPGAACALYPPAAVTRVREPSESPGELRGREPRSSSSSKVRASPALEPVTPTLCVRKLRSAERAAYLSAQPLPNGLLRRDVTLGQCPADSEVGSVPAGSERFTTREGSTPPRKSVSASAEVIPTPSEKDCTSTPGGHDVEHYRLDRIKRLADKPATSPLALKRQKTLENGETDVPKRVAPLESAVWLCCPLCQEALQSRTRLKRHLAQQHSVTSACIASIMAALLVSDTHGSSSGGGHRSSSNSSSSSRSSTSSSSSNNFDATEHDMASVSQGSQLTDTHQRMDVAQLAEDTSETADLSKWSLIPGQQDRHMLERCPEKILCSLCQQSMFRSFAQLKVHLQEDHPEDYQVVQKTGAGLPFRVVKSLEGDVRSEKRRCKEISRATNISPSTSPPPLFGQSGNSQLFLSKYLDPTRPFKCSICMDSFTQQSILDCHLNSVLHLHRVKKVSDGGEQGRVSIFHEANTHLTGSPGDCDPALPLSQKQSERAEMSLGDNYISDSLYGMADEAIDLSMKLQKPLDCKTEQSTISDKARSVHVAQDLSKPKATDSHESPQDDSSVPSTSAQLKVTDLEARTQAQAWIQAQAQTQQELQQAVLLQQQLLQQAYYSHLLLSPDALLQYQQQQQMLLHYYYPGMEFQLGSSGVLSTKSSVDTPLQNLSSPAEPQRRTPTHEPKIESTMTTEVRASKSYVQEDQLVQCQDTQQDVETEVMQVASVSEEPLLQPRVPFGSTGNAAKALLANVGFELVVQFIEGRRKPHRNACEDRNTEKIQCQVCGRLFSNILILKSHQEHVHQYILPFHVLEKYSHRYREVYDRIYPLEAELEPGPTSNSSMQNVEQPPVTTPASPTVNNSTEPSNQHGIDLATLSQLMLQSFQIPFTSLRAPHLLQQLGFGTNSLPLDLTNLQRESGDENGSVCTDGKEAQSPNNNIRSPFSLDPSLGSGKRFDIVSKAEVPHKSGHVAMEKKPHQHLDKTILKTEMCMPVKMVDLPRNAIVSSKLNLSSEDAKAEYPSVSKAEDNSTIKRSKRTTFKEYQVRAMRESFQVNAYPREDEIKRLSVLLHLPACTIVLWFQNARQRYRRQRESEKDSEWKEGSGSDRILTRLDVAKKDSYEVQLTKDQDKLSTDMFEQKAKQFNHLSMTDEHLQVLNHCFSTNPYPKEKDIEQLSAYLGHPQVLLKAWYQQMRQNMQCPGFDELQIVEPFKLNSASADKVPVEIRSNSHSSKMNVKEKQSPQPRVLKLQDHVSVPPIQSPTIAPLSTNDARVSTLTTIKTEVMDSTVSAVELGSELKSKREKVKSSSTSVTRYICQPCKLTFVNLDRWQEHQKVHLLQRSGINQLTVADLPPTEMLKTQAEQDPKEEVPTLGENLEQLRASNTCPSLEELQTLYPKYSLDIMGTTLDDSLKQQGLIQAWYQSMKEPKVIPQQQSLGYQLSKRRCPFCRILFKDQDLLDDHIQTQHLGDGGPVDALLHGGNDGEGSKEGTSTKTTAKTVPEAREESTGSPKRGSYSPPPPQLSPSMLKVEGIEDIENPVQVLATSSSAGNQASKSFLPSEYQPAPTDTTPATSVPVVSVMQQSTACLVTSDATKVATMVAGAQGRSEEVMPEIGEDPCSLSPASGSGDAGSAEHPSGRRRRTHISSMQLAVMRTCYGEWRTPSVHECSALGKEIGLEKRVVQIWFQNARAKEKKAQRNVPESTGGGGGCGLSGSGTSGTLNPHGPDGPRTLCTLCGVRYSAKLSIQEHVFSLQHISRLKDGFRQQVEAEKASREQAKRVCLPSGIRLPELRPKNIDGESGTVVGPGNSSGQESPLPLVNVKVTQCSAQSAQTSPTSQKGSGHSKMSLLKGLPVAPVTRTTKHHPFEDAKNVTENIPVSLTSATSIPVSLPRNSPSQSPPTKLAAHQISQTPPPPQRTLPSSTPPPARPSSSMSRLVSSIAPSSPCPSSSERWQRPREDRFEASQKEQSPQYRDPGERGSNSGPDEVSLSAPVDPASLLTSQYLSYLLPGYSAYYTSQLPLAYLQAGFGSETFPYSPAMFQGSLQWQQYQQALQEMLSRQQQQQQQQQQHEESTRVALGEGWKTPSQGTPPSGSKQTESRKRCTGRDHGDFVEVHRPPAKLGKTERKTAET
uniref:zinc finger homeobox protein 3-like isoform X2 n=1 Tax=Myxine glutinosa TaxID=7769 RepID=UPI00358E78A1